MLIGREYQFEAAHLIEGHDTCGQVHGHTWTLTVSVGGPILDTGMVIDFHDLNHSVRKVTALFDHRMINTILDTMEHRNAWKSINGGRPATAETLVRYITYLVAIDLKARGHHLDRIYCRLQEGPGGWAESHFSHGELSS